MALTVDCPCQNPTKQVLFPIVAFYESDRKTTIEKARKFNKLWE